MATVRFATNIGMADCNRFGLSIADAQFGKTLDVSPEIAEALESRGLAECLPSEQIKAVPQEPQIAAPKDQSIKADSESEQKPSHAATSQKQQPKHSHKKG